MTDDQRRGLEREEHNGPSQAPVEVLAAVTVEQGRWKSPVVVTKLSIFIYSAAIALCFCVVIALSVWYLLDRRQQAADRAEEQQEQIAQLQSVTRQLRVIQNPTPEEYRARLKEGIERCLQEPECKRLFPTIENDGGSNP